MKFFALLSAFVLMLSGTLKAQPVPPSAAEIMKEAYQLAASEHKNVFVIFHASWCVWCRKMDSSMADASCKNYFDDNYVIRHLVVDESKDKKNLENPGAAELKKELNGDGQGLPYWAVVNKEGKLLFDSRLTTGSPAPVAGPNTGCPASEAEVDYFVNILKKTSQLTDPQLEVIRQRFRKNDQ
jgi:thiol-disulfide isomerase/thioredoxin